MIKPVSALVFGDLVYYAGQRWQCVEGDADRRVLWALGGYRRPIQVFSCSPPVAVYAHRDSFDDLSFVEAP